LTDIAIDKPSKNLIPVKINMKINEIIDLNIIDALKVSQLLPDLKRR